MTDVSNVMSDERRVFVSAHCEVCRTSLASLADSELLEESVAAVRSVGTLISPTSSLKTTRSGHKHNLYALPLKKLTDFTLSKAEVIFLYFQKPRELYGLWLGGHLFV